MRLSFWVGAHRSRGDVERGHPPPGVFGGHRFSESGDGPLGGAVGRGVRPARQVGQPAGQCDRSQGGGPHLRLRHRQRGNHRVQAQGVDFGGGVLACAAASAVVDELRGVIPGVAERADRARRRFLEMADRYPTVGDVRGLGLMIGVELVDGEGRPDKQAFESVFQHSFREGLFFLPCGTDGNVIRFIPPLNVSLEHLERALDIIEAGLADYEARR